MAGLPIGIGDIIAIATLLYSAPATVKNVLSHLKKRRIKFLLPKNKTKIFIPARDIGRPQPVCAVEDFRAAFAMNETLRDFGLASQVAYTESSGNFLLDSEYNNIVICGPKNSHIIQSVFNILGRYTFVQHADRWVIYDKITQNDFVSPLDRSPPSNSDIAFFGKVSMPSDPSNTFLLICGIHALGSLGVSSFLKNRTAMMELSKKVKNNRFTSLIRCQISQQHDIMEANFFQPPEIY